MDEDKDLDEVISSGDQLPEDMFGDDLPRQIMGNPVFDGEKVVDLDEVQS